jgi:SAM-dependent methyltransferase
VPAAPETGDHDARAATLARYYDLDVAEERDDIAMYLALASASDGPVLELACGSGRIAVPLAAAGKAVTGVDIDGSMLERASTAWQSERAHASPEGSLHLVKADVTELDLGRRFDLVILGFNSILLLHERAAQQRVIKVMTRHLTEDGRAIIDVWLPTEGDLTLYDGRIQTDWTRRDDVTGDEVTKMTTATYDHATRRATVDTIFEAWHGSAPVGRFEKRDEIRFVTADEVLAMLATAGLQPQVVAGDYAMNEVDSHSDRLITIAARSGRPGTTVPDVGRL